MNRLQDISSLTNGARKRLLLVLCMALLSLMVFGLANAGPAQQEGDPPQDDGMPSAGDIGAPVVPVLVQPATAEVEARPSEAQGVPFFDIWYGVTQDFGQLGNPQPWVDVLGNVMPDPGRSITSLSYRLNGGTAQALSVGPDSRRLNQKGDFHIELDRADLSNGANQVVITAVDNAGETASKTVTVNYSQGNTWPLPYTANWSAATKIHDVAQPTDGLWILEGGKLRTEPSAIGYDRIVAIGDLSWTDYEVTVPFTVNGVAPRASHGLGIIMRWPGHFQQGNEQPRTGWQGLGALAWHRWQLDSSGQLLGSLQMIGYSVGYGANGNIIDTNPNVQVEIGKEYVFKMSVQSATDKDIYRFKVWPKAQAEPAEWQMVGEVDDAGRPKSGSMALLAHYVDVSFGNVAIKPTSSINPVLSVNTDGNGSVDWEPKGPYKYGDVVTIQASPGSGSVLARWSGDVAGVGRARRIGVALTEPAVDITAHFVPEQYGTLTVNADPAKGSATVVPDQAEYLIGEVVTLSATAQDGFRFQNWGGDVSSTENPYSFVFTGNSTVNANFQQRTAYALDLTTIGDGTIAKNPDKPQFFEYDIVQLTGVANPGSKFQSWGGALAGQSNPSYLLMDGNKSVSATFQEVADRYTLTVNTNGPGTVVIEPNKSEYLFGEVVKLTAVPDSEAYMLGSWSGDLGGNSSPVTFGMFSNRTITANFVPAVDPRSDDFNRCVLDNGRWTIFDPKGVSTFSMTGTSLKLAIPAGTEHEFWTGRNEAPRVLTPADNADFGLDVKFDTPFDIKPANRYQAQGIVIQESNNKLLRFDFINDGAATRIFAGVLEDGTGSSKSNKTIGNGAPLYMRITRMGNTWTQYYSYDGQQWTQAAKFDYALNVTAAGLFALNPENAPAFTAEFDYFFNAGAPIIPQDTNTNTVSVTTSGEGSVVVEPQKEEYACGEQVTLTAVPAEGWNFIGWSGDLSGFANPATLTVERSHAVLARFSTGEAGVYEVYLPVGLKP